MGDSSKNTFERWPDAMGFDNRQAAQALGKSVRIIKMYIENEQRPPMTTRLLMGCLREGWRPRPWPER